MPLPASGTVTLECGILHSLPLDHVCPKICADCNEKIRLRRRCWIPRRHGLQSASEIHATSFTRTFFVYHDILYKTKTKWGIFFFFFFKP